MAIAYWPTNYWGSALTIPATVPAGALSICNQALLNLGAEKIISFTDGSVASTLCNDKWATVRDAVLRSHPWNCVIKRGTLTVSVKSVTSITRIGTTATVTSTAHGYANGDFVRVAGAAQAEYNGVFAAFNVTVNAFDYTVSGTPTTPATGTITTTTVPAHGYAYRHVLPSDLLRLLEVKDSAAHRVENGSILSDDSTIKIKYIYQETDPAKYDKLLVSAITAAMGAEIAYPITRSHTAQEAEWKLYLEKLRLARSIDAQEDTPDEMGDFPFLNNR